MRLPFIIMKSILPFCEQQPHSLFEILACSLEHLGHLGVWMIVFLRNEPHFSAFIRSNLECILDIIRGMLWELSVLLHFAKKLYFSLCIWLKQALNLDSHCKSCVSCSGGCIGLSAALLPQLNTWRLCPSAPQGLYSPLLSPAWNFPLISQ